MFSFNIKKVDWDKKLGSGRFGKVYAYNSRNIDDPCVVKHLTTNNEHEMLEYVQEIVLGFGCSHPNILSVRGYSIQFEENVKNWNVFIKLSQMESSLKDQLNQKKRFSEKQIAKYFYDLSNGLGYLHEKGIVHRDIKPDNILINKNDELRITDFGLCKFIGEEMSYTLKDIAGTRRYTAPEILAKIDESNPRLKKRDLFKADLWSLGLVMAELCLSGYENQNGYELPEKIKKLQGKEDSKGLIEIILCLLRVEPSNRKPLHEVQKMLEEYYPFLLKKLNKEVEASIKIEPIEKLDDLEIERRLDISQVLKEFQEKWKKDFKIQIEFEKSVKIEKANIRVTNDHMKSLMEEFTQVQNLTKSREIKQFEMDLYNCSQITHDGAKELAQRIGSDFKSVQQLTLIFGNWFLCNAYITDSSLKELAQQIGSNLKNIQDLRLDFGRCGISDEGLKELCTQIGANIKTIQKLNLYFDGCERITDSGFTKLSLEIGTNLKQLQELGLSFGYCTRITDDGLNKLSQQIGSNLKNLQTLKLCFYKTRVSEKAKEEFKRSCMFIPEMKIDKY